MQALLAPFRLLWAGWKKFAHVLGVINRTILLTVFYFVLVNLVNLGLRVSRRDLLDRRMRAVPSYWHPKTARVGANAYQHQF